MNERPRWLYLRWEELTTFKDKHTSIANLVDIALSANLIGASHSEPWLILIGNPSIMFTVARSVFDMSFYIVKKLEQIHYPLIVCHDFWVELMFRKKSFVFGSTAQNLS